VRCWHNSASISGRWSSGGCADRPRSTRTTYYHGLNPLAEQTGTGPRAWYLRDQLGSVRQTYDDSGALLPNPTVRYDSFGAVRAGTPADHGFTGENWDAATGLVNLRARWYDPAHGTFTSRDPFGGWATSPASQHPYQYAANSPAQYTDPSGKCIGVLGGADTLFCAAVIGAVISGVIDYGTQVYGNYQAGYRGADMFTHICVDELLIAMASGAVGGGVGYALVPLLAPIAQLGFVGSMLAGAAEGEFAAGAGQVTTNLLSGRAWNTGIHDALQAGAQFGAFAGLLKGGLGGIRGGLFETNEGALRGRLLGFSAGHSYLDDAAWDSIDQARAFEQKATNLFQQLVSKARRTYENKTIAVSRKLLTFETLSGWNTPRRFRQATAEVLEYANARGYSFPRKGMYDGGVPGQFHASHAELQANMIAPGRPIGVSREMCGVCQSYFREVLAPESRVPLVVADPEMVRVFHPNKWVTVVYPDDGTYWHAPSEYINPNYGLR
jgi:RHS repeat-associated protein